MSGLTADFSFSHITAMVLYTDDREWCRTWTPETGWVTWRRRTRFYRKRHKRMAGK